jgi:hypothetical protein
LAERSDQILSDEKVLIEYERTVSDYWLKVNLNLELQKAESDVHQMIEVENEYLKSWSETILRKIFNEECYRSLQVMNSSIIDLDEEKEICIKKNLETFEFLQILQEAMTQWEEVFCSDNLVIFDDESWRNFVGLKPKVDYGEGWKIMSGKKKFRGFNHNRRFKLDMTSWYKLKRTSDLISFVHNIDGTKNNVLYFSMMKSINIDDKVKKHEEFLEKVRVQEFIKNEANLQYHQSNLLPLQQVYLQYPQIDLPQP